MRIFMMFTWCIDDGNIVFFKKYLMHISMYIPSASVTDDLNFCFKNVLHSQTYLLKKIASWCLILIYSSSDSSESWEEVSRLSVIYLTTIYISIIFLKNTCG